MSRNNLSNTVEVWTKFDIESVKRELDDKVIEIAKSLEEGDESRKRLIEQTKDFRKNLNDEQRKLVGSILKSFQVEVDSSSKRNKLMEQVLLKLYKQIIDLPDPVQALENVQRVQKKAERVQDLEIENKQLRETLDEYNLEFAEVKNQEVTIKALKDKIKELEEKSEQNVLQRVKEKEKEAQRFYTDKEEQLKSQQLDLVKKLGETEARCLSLQSQLHKSQTDLYDIKSKQDDSLNAKSLEIDLLLQDIDKLNERVVNAERLNEQYIQQLSMKQNQLHQQNLATNSQNNLMLTTNFQTSALEVELSAKEKEISQLVEDIQKLQLKSNKTREFYENQRAQLEEKLVGRERVLEQLEFELRNKQDYEEIKKELSILKSIEFSEEMFSSSSKPANNEDGLVTNAVGAPSEQLSESMQQKPLEVLLLEKNRHLQNENTQFKNKMNDLMLTSNKLTRENLSLMNVNLEQKTLIVELEKDLLRLAQNDDSGTNKLDLEIENSRNQAESVETVLNLDNDPNNEAKSSADTSLFNIVSSQRERFRVRVQELEIENLSSKQQCLFLTNELDRLRSDNVKLYEKIKFLQSFSKKQNLENFSNSNNYVTNENEDESFNVLNKYTNEYEKRLDPFSKFNYREKQKRYTDLKLHDKFTLSFGRFILSSKLARLIFFAYFFVIHLLIFLSLYSIAHRDASHRDLSAVCAHAYQDHMAEVHGQREFKPPH